MFYFSAPRKPTSLPVSSQNDTSDQRLSTDFSDPLQYPSESYRFYYFLLKHT